MMNIMFKTPNSEEVYFARLPDDFTLADMTKSVPELGDLNKFRLLIDDNQLCLDNEAIFNRQKQLIQPYTCVTLLQRAPGGTFIEISLLKEIILEELKKEMTKLNRVTAECDFCRCEELCATIHCIHICIDCFPNYLHDTNFELRCNREIQQPSIPECLLDLMPSHVRGKKLCGQVIDYHNFFVTPEFIDKWSVLCDVTDLVKNIDCQICYCGALLFNITMFAKQQCSNCQRWFCFFCNRNWDEEKMKNEQFTCTDNDCEYQRRLAFDLVPLEMNKSIMVPDRRCCPNCCIVGGYGVQCKYHGCPHCKHQFCFICLETEANCKRIYKSSYSHQCTRVKRQNYSMFPRINEETHQPLSDVFMPLESLT